MASSFIETVLQALAQAEQEQALKTGRGKFGTTDVGKPVGIAEGLRQAGDIVRATAKRFATDDDEVV